MVQAPGDTTRWFVSEKSGAIKVFANNSASSSTTDFIDISARIAGIGEGGLLSFAFHPSWPGTPEVYIAYTQPGLISTVSRFYSSDGGMTLNPTVEDVILEVPEPFNNHNIGTVAFGPDGNLYVGFGDGGDAGDPNENGQNTSTLNGAIVRINVDGAPPYEIPAGNPFSANTTCPMGSGTDPCPEIYAWGLRNPWRFSFDFVTGRMWAGDVGQNAWEEIDLIEVGENYGWNDREGAHCYDPPSGCADTFREPHAEYGHALGQSVTGGFVYRGSAVSNLAGWYVFGDFVNGRIFGFEQSSAEGVVPDILFESGVSIVSFAEDADGELYVLDYFAGTIHRIEDAP